MRKMPVKTKAISLDGDWEGWNYTARTNPPISIFGHIASGDFDRIALGVAKILVDWNFVDEEGTPMPKPSLEAVSELPIDLVTAVANKYVEEMTKLPPA